MKLTRRFVFRGNAAAIGGRLVHPDLVLEVKGGSSLPVTGGRSISHLDGRDHSFGPELSFSSADTFAEGFFNNPAAAIKTSWGDVQEDTLTTSSRVYAEIRDIVAGIKPQLTVRRLRGELTAQSPLGSGEPRIRVADQKGNPAPVAIETVKIDNTYELAVELNVDPFQQHDTRAKLLAAADTQPFVDAHDPHLFMRAATAGLPATPAGRLFQHCGIIYGTIVRGITWVGNRAYPNSVIDGHSVFIPNFGTIFFGEIFITSLSRRLTMMRLKLGSPQSGDVGFSDVETNGMWYP